VFAKIILNFLSIQNILLRQGTALFQFNEGTASHTTQLFREQVLLMGIKGSMLSPSSPTCFPCLGSLEIGFQAHNSGNYYFSE
jgi:hypothetical protein